MEEYQTQILDHLGIVAGICNEIELIEQIDRQVPKRNGFISVGQAVQAMVINAMGFVGRPLYLTPEFFRNKPVDLLVGEGVEAEHLNSYSLGRALDKLYEAGVTEVFAVVATHALRVFGIEVRQVHLDSTSFSLHGEYATEDEERAAEPGEPVPIRITHGYSRDRRPDLKQAMLSLMSANASSLPVWLAALDGNSSDQTHFRKAVKAYMGQFGEDEETPMLIADSALYKKADLEALSAMGKWLTRVPGTLKAVRELYEQITPATMETEDDTAYWQEIGSIYGGVKQRWIVVYHRGTAKKDARAFERRLEKQRISAEKALHRLSRREFGCRDAVTKALDGLTNSWRYHSAQIACHKEPRYDRPGRPGPDAQPRYVWKFTGQVVEDEDAIATARAAHGKYVLATNELDDRAFPAPTLLNMYKEQSTTVERGFRFLKDPLFFADSFFLNKPSRIMALLMVMGLSLLVYSLAERHLRQQLADHNEFIPDQKGKPTQRPTARRVFQMFEGIHVLLIQQNGHQQRLIVNLTALHHQMLNLFSKQVQDIYHLRL